MKTKVSYFPGMFENPTPAKYYFFKQNQKTMKTIYECVEK